MTSLAYFIGHSPTLPTESKLSTLCSLRYFVTLTLKSHSCKDEIMNNSNDNVFEDQSMCSPIVSTILAAAISLVSILAFVGNILVTVTFLMNTTLRTSTNYFIVNMAVSDLLSSLTNWPVYATEGMLSLKHLIDGPVAKILCKLGLYSRSVSLAVSILSLVWIVVERYIAVVHPFKAVMLTKRLRAVLLTLTWIIPLLLGVPYIPYSKIVKHGRQTYCRFLWDKTELYYASGFVLFFCAPLILIIIFYSKIMKALAGSRPMEEEAQDSTRIRNHKQNQTVMKVFVSIVTVFFVCWTPLCVFLLFKIAFPSLFIKDSCMLLARLFFYVLPSLPAAINPIILFAFSSNFLKALKDILSCFACKPC